MTVIVSKGRPVDQAKGLPGMPPGYTRTVGPTWGSIPLLTGEANTASYAAIVRSQPWVYAVVSKLTYAIARLPFNAYEYVGDDPDGGRERARGSDLDRLLTKPRPGVSAFSLKAGIAWDLLVYGHALVMKQRPSAGAPPTALWNVPWTCVQTVEDETEVLGYNVVISGTPTPLDPGQVIHYALPGGVAPLESLRRTLALEDAATEWQGQSFKNGVTPRGAFTSDQRLNEATLPRLREDLQALYAGPDNAGRFGLFDQGLKWSQMGQSAVDAEIINQRKLSREEVCGAYDVSPPLVGILDRATFNNVELLHTALYVDTLGPRLTLIEEAIQTQLVDPEPAWDGYFVEWNLNEMLKPNAEARMRAYLSSQQSSTTTINERRRAENLPPMDAPYADEVLVPANMLPVSLVGEEAPEPAAVEAAEAMTRLLLRDTPPNVSTEEVHA